MATRSWLITSPSVETLPARPKLRVQLVSGEVTVSSHDGDTITVELHEITGNPIEVVLDAAMVSVGYPSIGWDGWVKRLTSFRSSDAARVTVRVPRATEVSIATAAAVSTLTDVNSDCTLNSVSGTLYVARVEGRVRARTFSGSITVDQQDGPIAIQSASGAVAIHGTAARVSVSTGSGAVRLRNSALNSVASVTTLSGDVSVSLGAVGLMLTSRTVGGVVEVDGVNRRTSSGPAVVTVDERGNTNACWLTTNTVTGDVRVQRAGSDSM